MHDVHGRLIACQLLITGLIARVANEQRDPVGFLTDFRDEMRAIVAGVRIEGQQGPHPARTVARDTMDELFSLLKAPSTPDPEA